MELQQATVTRVLPNGRVSVTIDKKPIMASNPQQIPVFIGKIVSINSSREIVKQATKKVDIWMRATEDEVVAIQEGIDNAPFKTKLTFRDIDEIDHLEDFFVEIKTLFSDLFGETRAEELLAKSL